MKFLFCGRGENDKMVRADETLVVVEQINNARYEKVPNWIHPIERLDSEELTTWIKS